MIEVLIAAVPLLLLLASLLAGYYPGCETIVRLAERIGGAASRRSAVLGQRRPAPPRSHAASGGLLLGLGLSGRAPPA